MSETVERIHAEFKTPQSIVFRAVREATAQIPAKREKIVRGYENEVYKVTTHEEEFFIVRVRRHGTTPFVQEAWALEQARHMGAPVPQVYAVSEAVIQGIPRDVMVLEHIPGDPLEERLATMSSKEIERVLAQTGEALAKIHRIPVGGFYHRHSGGIWDFSDWDGIMESSKRDRRKEAPLLIDFGISPEIIEEALALIDVYHTEFPDQQPILCHGDLYPAHLLVDKYGDLTGLIDFGEFQGGPRIHDLAYFSMACPGIPLEWLRAGYDGGVNGNEALFNRQLLLHKVLLQLGHLAHYIEQGWEEDAKLIADGLLTSLMEWRIVG